jgi:molybdenum cofactor cytidylyltransferase
MENPQEGNRSVACAILGAGMSKRFGEVKQLAEIDQGGNRKRLLQAAVDAAEGSRATPVFLVLGHCANEILKTLKINRARVLVNHDYMNGLSTSIRTAIEQIPASCGGVILMVGDQPFLRAEHLNMMIESFERRSSPSSSIVALAYKGEARNPVLFARDYFQELSALRGDVGGKQILQKWSTKVSLICIEDSRVFLDVDTKSDLPKKI